MLYAYITRLTASLAETAFLPFFAVWLIKTSSFDVYEIGFITSACIMMSRMGAVFISNFIHRHKKRSAVIVALLITMMLYIVLYFLQYYKINIFLLWLVLLTILGIAISIISVAIVSLVPLILHHKFHTFGFSYMNLSVNIAAGSGPVLGGYMVAFHTDFFIVTPIIATLLSLILALKLPVEHDDKVVEHPFSFDPGQLKKVTLFAIANFCTFIAYAQFFYIFPIYAAPIIGPEIVGVFLGINSLFIILFQIPTTHLHMKGNMISMIIFANILAAIGSIALSFISNDIIIVIMIVISVLALTIAEIIYGNLYETLGVRILPHNPFQSLAITNFAWGAGEGVANFIGIYLVHNGQGFYSFAFGAISAFLAILAIYPFYKKRYHTKKIL